MRMKQYTENEMILLCFIRRSFLNLRKGFYYTDEAYKRMNECEEIIRKVMGEDADLFIKQSDIAEFGVPAHIVNDMSGQMYSWLKIAEGTKNG